MTPDAVRQLQEAAGWFGRGNLDKTRAICADLLRKYPEQVDVLHLLALVSKQASDAEAAERLFRRCLARTPGRADIRGNLANLYASTGRSDDAIREYRIALDADAACRPAALGLARVLYRTGRLEEALSVARRLTDTNPDDAEAWLVSGSALRAKQRHAEAEAAYRRSLRIRPASGVAHHNLGASLAEQGKSEEALAELGKARDLGVSGSEINRNTAAALIALDRLDEAADILAQQIADDPRDIKAHGLYARVLHFRGEASFTRELLKALDRFPGDPELRILCAQLLRGAGRLAEARSTLEAAPQADDPRILAESAAAWQESGRFDLAREAAAKAVGAAPGNAYYADRLMEALLSLGEASAAMNLIETARARDPSNQWYIAMEATAARLLDDPRYAWLYDYERFVRSYELPVPEGWSDLGSFQDALESALTQRHRLGATPLDQSLRSGTQTARSLLGDPDPQIQAFLRALEGPLADYCAMIGGSSDHPLTARNSGTAVLSGCWSVRLGAAGYHVNHVHPEGWISSAYYVRVPEQIKSAQDKSGWIKFGEPRFPVPGAGPAHFVTPAPGKLVLFPSYMWHGTVPTSTRSGPRLTIAFDAIPDRR